MRNPFNGHDGSAARARRLVWTRLEAFGVFGCDSDSRPPVSPCELIYSHRPRKGRFLRSFAPKSDSCGTPITPLGRGRCIPTVRLVHGPPINRWIGAEGEADGAFGGKLDFFLLPSPPCELRGKSGHLFLPGVFKGARNGGFDCSRGERLPPSHYENLSVDPDLAAKVTALFRTGMWSSKRALYHDLIRRGLMEVLASAPTSVPVPPASPPPAPAAVPSEGPSTADAQAEPSASRRPRSRSGRPPRPPADVENERVSLPNPVDAGAVTAEAVEPSIPPTAVPGTTRDGGSSSAPATSAPAVGIHPEATWTCPACKGAFSLEERWVHKPKCPAAGSSVPGVPLPGFSRIDTERLRDRILGSLRDAGRSPNPRAYLIALVQRAVEDQRLPPPSDAEAGRMIEALARRDPEVDRLLRRVVT